MVNIILDNNDLDIKFYDQNIYVYSYLNKKILINAYYAKCLLKMEYSFIYVSILVYLFLSLASSKIISKLVSPFLTASSKAVLEIHTLYFIKIIIFL